MRRADRDGHLRRGVARDVRVARRRPRVLAAGFAAAIGERHRAARAAWMPPATRVWRRSPALPPHVHVQVVAPVTLVTRTATAREAEVPARKGRDVAVAEPVLRRLAGRAERVDSVMPARVARSTASPVGAGALEMSPHVVSRAVPQAPPLALVLARPSAPAAAASVPSPGEAPREPSRPRRMETHDGDARVESIDVGRLTDRVVAAIDRRLLAARERMRT